MTIKEVIEINSKISYKDNFKLSGPDMSRCCDFLGFDLVVYRPDVKTLKMGPLIARFKISNEHLKLMDKEQYLYFIKERVVELEAHDTYEWLKYDNKCIVEPHPELQP